MKSETTNPPKWAQKFLSAHDVNLLQNQIKEIEEKTSSEIIIAVAQSSTAHRNLFALIFIISFLSLWIISGYQWSSWDTLYINLERFFGLLAASLFSSGLLYTQPKLRRLFLSRRDRSESVLNKAWLCFYNQRIQHTQAQTGVLIYLSLFEKEAAILGDQAISSKLQDSDWQHYLEKIIQAIREKKPMNGLQEAISEIGEKLHTHFPAGANNPNELSNQVIFIGKDQK